MPPLNSSVVISFLAFYTRGIVLTSDIFLRVRAVNTRGVNPTFSILIKSGVTQLPSADIKAYQDKP